MASRLQKTARSLGIPPLRRTAVRTVQLVAALHLFSTSVAEIRLCSGFSMLPTISHEGEWVLVSPLPYWSILYPAGHRNGPKRGELVFATSPVDPAHTVCKRVIGVEGDLIEVEPRRGEARKWNSSKESREVGVDVQHADTLIAHRRGEGHWIRIPKGSVWLAGDNMSNSTDSRTYGPVPLALVKGRVLARVSCPPFRVVSSRIALTEVDMARVPLVHESLPTSRRTATGGIDLL